MFKYRKEQRDYVRFFGEMYYRTPVYLLSKYYPIIFREHLIKGDKKEQFRTINSTGAVHTKKRAHFGSVGVLTAQCAHGSKLQVKFLKRILFITQLKECLMKFREMSYVRKG